MKSRILVCNIGKGTFNYYVIVTDCRLLQLPFVLILTGFQEAHVWGPKMKENLTLVRLQLKVISKLVQLRNQESSK